MAEDVTTTSPKIAGKEPIFRHMDDPDVPFQRIRAQRNADGTIAVSYYDLQNATAAQPGLTDAYLVTCPAATSDCTNPASWAAGAQTLLSTTGSGKLCLLGSSAYRTEIGSCEMGVEHVLLLHGRLGGIRKAASGANRPEPVPTELKQSL